MDSNTLQGKFKRKEIEVSHFTDQETANSGDQQNLSIIIQYLKCPKFRHKADKKRINHRETGMT